MSTNNQLAEALRRLINCFPIPVDGVEQSDRVSVRLALFTARTALAAHDAQPEQGEREAFEAWAQTHHKLVNPGPLARLGGTGRYFYGPVEACWKAWQARAALAATPAAEPKAAPLTDDEFGAQWRRQTRRIMGTDKGLLLEAKRVTERAHGIGASEGEKA